MIIVGNLKMNQSLSEAIEYEKKLVHSEIIICPSYPYLSLFKQNGYKLCAQNVSGFNNGPYTGEVSASQIKSLDVDYVLIGHSERRHVFNETQTTINDKINKALENELNIVYCIGETYEQKNNDKTFSILEEQIKSVFDQVNLKDIKHIVIGYEPVWAISDGINPGLTPTIEEINKVNEFIKIYIQNNYNSNIKVLYGGSVNLNNIKELLNLKNNDGFLIGGASKNVDDLLKINEICKQ